MPRFDGTGPNGEGPMTGRGRGYCVLARNGARGARGRLVGYAGLAGRPVRIESVSSTQEEKTMPRGDGTGPAGQGPMTGRATGYCAGYNMPGYANPAAGQARRTAPAGAYGPAPQGAAPRPPGARPFGMGRGPGRGMGRGFRGGRGRGRGGPGRGRW